MSIRILYSPQNLSELFLVPLKTIRIWTRLGILPALEGCSPIMYDKKDIDAWVASGGLEKHRLFIERENQRGVYYTGKD